MINYKPCLYHYLTVLNLNIELSVLENKNPRHYSTLEDQGPLRTQGFRGPRTLENPGPLRTKGYRGPRNLDRRPISFERKLLIKC